MLSTSAKPEDKRERRARVKSYHTPNFESNKISDPIFFPKMAYTPFGKSEKHVAFFASEINKGQDVYLEFCDINDTPEDPERKLYRWRFNPHFESEYEKTEPHATTGHCRYLIPIEELTVIKMNTPEPPKMLSTKTPEKKSEPQLTLGLNTDVTDAPVSEMTIRDLAAILLKKPVSERVWLNDLIKNKK